MCDFLQKFVPRLNKHDDVIESKLMKIDPPRNEKLVVPVLSDIKMLEKCKVFSKSV